MTGTDHDQLMSDYDQLTYAEEMAVIATHIRRYKDKVAQEARDRLNLVNVIAAPGSETARLALIDQIRKEDAALKAYHYEKRIRAAAEHAG